MFVPCVLGVPYKVRSECFHVHIMEAQKLLNMSRVLVGPAGCYPTDLQRLSVRTLRSEFVGPKYHATVIISKSTVCGDPPSTN